MNMKTYIELPAVTRFFSTQPAEVLAEYEALVELLEEHGRLTSPFAEKVEPGLFATRLRSTRNVRVFYVYAEENSIYGIHAYEKKTRRIPRHELQMARKIMNVLRCDNG